MKKLKSIYIGNFAGFYYFIHTTQSPPECRKPGKLLYLQHTIYEIGNKNKEYKEPFKFTLKNANHRIKFDWKKLAHVAFILLT